jgi:chromosome segregation ATPase
MPKHDIGELIAALNEAVNKLNNLRTKYDDLEKENARLRAALEGIKEYWNGAAESAVDAAEECRDRACAALTEVSANVQ